MTRGRVVRREVACEGKDVVPAREPENAEDIKRHAAGKVRKEIIPMGGNGTVQSRF